MNLEEIVDLHPQRREEGVPHHPKSVELVKALAHIDEKIYGNYFDWRTGGDGDNGETLMYEMDIYFESLDRTPTIASKGQE